MREGGRDDEGSRAVTESIAYHEIPGVRKTPELSRRQRQATGALQSNPVHHVADTPAECRTGSNSGEKAEGRREELGIGSFQMHGDADSHRHCAECCACEDVGPRTRSSRRDQLRWRDRLTRRRGKSPLREVLRFGGCWLPAEGQREKDRRHELSHGFPPSRS